MMGTINRPVLYRLGGLALGALGGLQVGLWRMRSLYRQVDPQGTIRAEMEVLFKAARGLGPCPITGPPEKGQSEARSEEKNKYGDELG
jgi:hypothetical protein